MTEDEAPPLDPPPHHDAPAALPEGAGIGTLGVALIGGAVAAAVGLLVAIPLVRRRPKAKEKPAPQPRRQRRKRSG